MKSIENSGFLCLSLDMKKKFEELYDIETIKNYVDETPAGVMISQVEKYTKNQLVVLHGILNPLPRKQDLLTLYNRAFDLKDDNALSILVNKYGIDRMLFTNELPGVSDKEVDKAIEDIYNFIKTINPNVNRECFKSKTNRRLMNGIYLKYMDYSGNKLGLNAREYLKDVPRYSL